MILKEISRKFVASHFGIRDSFFDACWETLSENYEGITPAGLAQRNFTMLARPLAISGDEESEAVSCIVVFLLTERRLPSDATQGDIVAFVKSLLEEYRIGQNLGDELISAVITAGSQTTNIFGRMWTNDTGSDGGPIESDTELKDILESRKSYDIFIVDKGEGDKESCGEITIVRNDESSKRQTSGPEVFITRDLDPLHYRILVHTLRKGGVAGTLLELAEACWRDVGFLKLLKDKRDKINDSTDPEIAQLRSRIITAASAVSSFLEDHLRITLRTRKKRIYRLSSVPQYCVVQIRRHM